MMDFRFQPPPGELKNQGKKKENHTCTPFQLRIDTTAARPTPPPYTGLILTARETPEVRRELMAFGVSQIDAGSRIKLGGYTEAGDAQAMEREQFRLGDIRSLDEVMGELMRDGYLPSFCTSCYRSGRTGGHFMEFSIPGFIKEFCTPNALLALQEYLEDYASPETRATGEKLVAQELEKLGDGDFKDALRARLADIREKKCRDSYF